MSEFYVGYLPKAPPHLGRWIRRVVIALAVLAVTIAILLVIGQSPFAASRFEYQQYHDYQGVISQTPYPNLFTAGGRYLLVAPGKHGAESLLQGLDLRNVQLRGALIERGTDRMLELEPGSIRSTSPQAVPVPVMTDLGDVTLTGEIADSKCYLGVMNPGSGKVHRDCAVRCISGGIPPSLVVTDSSGAQRALLLTGPGGRKLTREVLEFVAEPVRISGRLGRLGDKLILSAEPHQFKRISRE